ncbi:PAS domain-containing protein [Phormidium sp. CLA17]|uniref:chemotaxis protein CheB n=1 Tax=Leptolyngbya sp. Cla-17 TaxID=2803751 RepID=UPI001492547B|nr:chemotaxis protein CheB [Leptolyngbya sp. Cla-17]MBM0743983.1 PAS domain-containing protein [Leptolyngbya sp. Cla-17]
MTAEQAPSESTVGKNDGSPQTDAEAEFPIVGIVASAGGLEAFTQLLSHLPTDTGMGFVLVQHLSPDHKSMLSDILARATQMPVNEVQEGVVVEPNHIYVIPPNCQMTLVEGALRLAPREKVMGHGYQPGTALFESLANDRGHKAIAVVLSGGDGDGSRGLTAIKAAGGITFAQCEATAQVNSMPNTAVATGNVDFVLTPQQIAEEIGKLSRHPLISQLIPLISAPEISPVSADAISIIFGLLRSLCGVDFSLYKRTTLDRRIQRRMLLYKLEHLDEYAQYLQAHPDEVKALYEEILIHVTSFFRDAEVFDQLTQTVFPIITQDKSAETPIRIWVAGCATGEEVYSIAICLLEFLKNQAMHSSIQIFATDISDPAINKARSGIYSESQMAEVSAERREAFFIPLEGGSYQICKAVRELCVFARQDLSRDPPFSNLDLISCRNVLIYMGEELQQRLMPLFHYSLKPTGFLMLGTSESRGKYSDLFSLIDRKYKIYTKKPNANRTPFSFAISKHSIAKVKDRKTMTQPSSNGVDLQTQTDQLIANHYAPVGVVVNDKLEIVQVRGDTSAYLQLAPGKASLNLLKVARGALLVEIRAAIYQAQQQTVVVKRDSVRIGENNPSTVTLKVIPFKPAESAESCFLILFEAASVVVNDAIALGAPENLEQEVAQLRQALAAMTQEQITTQEYVQSMLQEQENVNQELKVANEEILSSNEELQSTNEELETAKEEIQASNEELNTTNEELRSRNLELHHANNDLTNLLASINIPILMLANDFRIRRFTPMAQRLFNFIPTDTGRHVSDIRTNLNLPDLEVWISEVLETLTVKEIEVQTQQGQWFTLRIRPYRTTENQIDGVVLVLLDIDALKRGAVALETARNYAEAIVETVQMPLIVLDSQLRVNSANRSFYQTFQVAPPETQQTRVYDLGNGQWNLPGLRSRLENVLLNNAQLQDFEITHYFEQIGQKTMLLNAYKILHSDDTLLLLLAIEDITLRRQYEAERSRLLTQEQEARQLAETANRTKDDFLSNLSHELRNPLNIMLGWAKMLRTRQLSEDTVMRALEVIERSARAQAQLIEDLLDVSRITSGKLNLSPDLIDLAMVVAGAIESVQVSAEEKTIQLVSHLTSVMMTGDRHRLQQVLWNLLTNAIKFTPAAGRVEVTLEVVQTDAEIRVSDTGQGISVELLPYIFDRFRQGDSSSSKSSQGLGLGLSIVRHIVESHGGKIRAESGGEGQGTTIIVRLPLGGKPLEVADVLDPLALSGLPANDDSIQLAADSTPIAPSLTGLRILAVDNEADSRELIQWILEDLGAKVMVVASAREAIAALTNAPQKFDVLISDIGMPEEDGLSLIRQVRAMESTVGQIPAAAVTAYASDLERQLAIDAGFQVHITKPIEPFQLAAMIATLAERD